jgi:nicotinamidase-related amidase
MQAKLLVIDPQNDFCDIPGATLPVAGADADMNRLAELIRSARAAVTDLIVTLDSHASVSIERTTFWKLANGDAVAPFTEITERAVREGRYSPRNEALRAEVLEYLRALEARARYKLMVWPVHCVVGTWGHNIHRAVAAEIAAWEEERQTPAFRVLKGLNPMTEQYSAVRAEVPREDDPLTQSNASLVAHTGPAPGGLLLVAGEAASHCVAATMTDVFELMRPEDRRRVVMLRDCMSAVAGFEGAAERFLAEAVTLGARVLTARQALAELN